MRRSKRNYNQLTSKLDSLSISSSAQKNPVPKKRPKRASTPPESIQELSELDLFKELSKTKPDIESIAANIEEQVKDHHDIVIRTVFIFILKLLGLEEVARQYQNIDVLRVDLKEMIERVCGYFEILDQSHEIPIFANKMIVKNLPKMLKVAFMEGELLIYKTRLLTSIFSWFQALSQCSVRLVRQGSIEIVGYFLRASIELMEKLDEELMRIKGLNEDSSEKIKTVASRLEFIEKFTDETLEIVVHPRERDVRSEIREGFLDIMEYFLLKATSRYLNGKELSILTRFLMRKEELEPLKSRVLNLFHKIYGSDAKRFVELQAFLKDFLSHDDFAKNVLQLALNPKNKSSIAALQLVLTINEKIKEDSPILEDQEQIYKLLVLGSKEHKCIVSELLLKNCFENPETVNLTFGNKMTMLLEILRKVEPGKIDLMAKFEMFIEETIKYWLDNVKPTEFIDYLLLKIKEKKPTISEIEEYLSFFLVLVQKSSSKNESEFNAQWSKLWLDSLEKIINKLKHEPTAFTLVLRVLGMVEVDCLGEPERIETLGLTVKSIRNALGFIMNLEFFNEVMGIMTSLSKVNSHLKEIAEEFINKTVKTEMEAFQGSFLQIFRNQLDLGLLEVKSELLKSLKLELQRISLLLKFFRIPLLLEEEFVYMVSEGNNRLGELVPEDQTTQSEMNEIRKLFISIIGLVHYWLLRGIFQDPDDLLNYTFYLKIHGIYLESLTQILSTNDKSNQMIPHALELAISFLSLVSNDKMSKLKGIYISPSDEIFRHILAYLEYCYKSKEQIHLQKDVFSMVFTLFAAPFQSLKLALAVFGKAFLRLAFCQSLWKNNNSSVLSGLINETLRSLKETEAFPQNKSTLTFWRIVQDLLFDVVNDHVLTNTEQNELASFICRHVVKVYFTGTGFGDKEKDAKYLEKYVIFLADSLVRGLESGEEFLFFTYLNSLVYKPVIESEHARKLLEFFRLEKRKCEEKIKEKGKLIEKMENYIFLGRFEGTLEKLAKEETRKKVKKAGKTSEENKKALEEAKESKRREIVEELEERRKETNEEEEEKRIDEDFDDKESKKVLEYNKESEKKQRGKKKKIN